MVYLLLGTTEAKRLTDKGKTMKLFYYEHCPYCVRVLMLVNYKHIKLERIVLANDDEETPIKMTGKKMLPTLQKESGEYLPESLDIIQYLDQLSEPTLPAHYIPEDIEQWLNKAMPYIRKLVYPRWLKCPFEEFKTQSSRDYFEHKKSKTLGSFAELMANTTETITAFQPILEELSDSVLDISDSKLTWEDIYLFPYVRSLTLVPGIKWPPAVEHYLDSKCPLFELDRHQVGRAPS